ncbi:MAG: hypothetical protein ACFCUI_02230 [Bernardetiaceae bacterium]
MPYRLFYLVLIGIVLSSCSKRSNCPTYWDSDPKMLFGEKPVAETLKERTHPSDPKNKKKYKPEKGYTKKDQKHNAKVFKKRRPGKLGKRNKRKKKYKPTEGAGN